MAAKGVSIGTKRKAAPIAKSEGKAPTKKAKVGSSRKAIPVKEETASDSDSDADSDDFGGLSDSDNGGVKVEADAPKKDRKATTQREDASKLKAAAGKTLEPGWSKLTQD